jgi:hypothetical protein
MAVASMPGVMMSAGCERGGVLVRQPPCVDPAVKSSSAATTYFP